MSQLSQQLVSEAPTVEMSADPQLVDSLTMLTSTWDLILSHKLYSVSAGGEMRKVTITDGLISVVGTVLAYGCKIMILPF